MKGTRINTNRLKISKFVYICVFFLFLIFAVSLGYRCLIDYKATDKLTISEFTSNRNIVEEVIMPERGTIYDRNGNSLAQDVSSYTLIAYLDSSRDTEDKINHVVEKEKTAKKLSEYIDTPYDRILEILNKDAYQVEFGNGGKNLSQLEMEAIKKLNLPGIDFIKSTKRYYSNGDFASYLLGYTKNKDDGNGHIYTVGELGIEDYYNQELSGKSGYIKYEQDGRGNKISNSNQYKEDAVDGSNVYLTIDSNVQLFIQNAVNKAQKDSKAEWVLMAVMDTKTGAILGYYSTPSYDPNIRNLTNYMDPLISYTYEPGSTMKTFSYMCAVDSGKYNGSDTFKSGYKTYTSATDKKDTVTIKDWNSGKGWGVISYDYGFAMSSNIGVANLVEKVISKKELSDCYKKYGFGAKTGITLNGELAGDIDFTYDVEVATAGYGQGIMVTPMQLLQGMTIVANDGMMVKPYVVEKVVGSNGKIEYSNEVTKVDNVVSKATAEKMRSLLRSVVVDDPIKGTGYAYYMKDYDLIGKTGTASIVEKGRYLTGPSDNIYSFAGLYPGDKPDVVIYMAIKKPQDTYNYVAPAVKDVVVNVSKYLNLDDTSSSRREYTVGDYKNNETVKVKEELKGNNINVVTLGNGDRVIGQYPVSNAVVYEKDTVYLLTNKYDKTMINFNGLSYKEVKEILNLMNVEYSLSGYGYAYEQNIPTGNKINSKVEIKFKGLY